MKFSKKEKYLIKKDKKLKKIIEKNGHITFSYSMDNQFDSLVGIVISQFISTNAANTIFRKIKKNFSTDSLNEKHFKICSNNNETWKKKFLLPIRFMVICEKGHIDDFPFIEWVHRKNKYDPEKCELRFVDGRGGNNSLMNVH